MPDPDSIDALARSAAHGDPAALDALLVAVRPEVLRLCARFLPNREDAEEACQDTLLALANGITRFEGRSSFRTWLHRLTANRARSTYRTLRRRCRLEAGGVPLPDQADPAGPAWSRAPASTCSTPSTRSAPSWPRWWPCGTSSG
ncbi:RNA polymerase sigma factor [Micromonospora sp. M12]